MKRKNEANEERVKGSKEEEVEESEGEGEKERVGERGRGRETYFLTYKSLRRRCS